LARRIFQGALPFLPGGLGLDGLGPLALNQKKKNRRISRSAAQANLRNIRWVLAQRSPSGRGVIALVTRVQIP